MADRVYKYALSPPALHEELVREQVQLSREYRRALVRTERSRRLLAHTNTRTKTGTTPS